MTKKVKNKNGKSTIHTNLRGVGMGLLEPMTPGQKDQK